MSLLKVSHLSKRFGGNRAVDDVSFELEPGQLLALIGPNGAGKSTTFNLVGGQLPATSGSVKFDGIELLGMASRKIAHLGIGRSFQIAATFASLTVAENVQMALLSHRREIYRFWRPAVHRYRDEALDLLAQVGMAQQADRPCSELAYGDVKRVELAMGIAGNPRLLLMDEPTAGMAPAERNALVGLVKRLVTERGMAVLFTEHSMDVVFAYADRIIVLARGQLIAEGSAEQIRRHPKVQEVYFGTGRTFGAAGKEGGTP
jgi:branched-chain amino acid transport system ATP-binding protein